MANARSAPLPLSDIERLLQGIVTDLAAPPDLAIEAFTVTAASLYTWCDPSDVELALTRVTAASPMIAYL